MSEQIHFIEDGKLVDNYVNVQAGDAIRLFPFGTIHKGGKKRVINKDTVFKMPHFKPPIKLGSHEDDTPAGGYLSGLEIREDGVYGKPEFTDKGAKALADGDYKYYSPEVIWEGGGVEDPETGELIEGPLIIGLALTHTPHLGEAAALYSIDKNGVETPEPIQKELLMSEQTVPVPNTLLERLVSLIPGKGDETPPEADSEKEDFSAIEKERDDFKAELEEYKANQAKAEMLTAIRKEFATDEFGAAFSSIVEEEGTAERLSELSDENRDWVLGKLKALSAQIDESNLTGEKGEETVMGDDPTADFNVAVMAYSTEHKVDYNEAVKAIAAEKPELHTAYVLAARGK